MIRKHERQKGSKKEDKKYIRKDREQKKRKEGMRELENNESKTKKKIEERRKKKRKVEGNKLMCKRNGNITCYFEIINSGTYKNTLGLQVRARTRPERRQA